MGNHEISKLTLIVRVRASASFARLLHVSKAIERPVWFAVVVREDGRACAWRPRAYAHLRSYSILTGAVHEYQIANRYAT